MDQEEIADDPKKPKTARAKKGPTSLAAAKRKFAAKNKDVDVMIKVKDEEGKIVEFENEGADEVVMPKKKKKAKTVRPAMGTDLDA